MRTYGRGPVASDCGVVLVVDDMAANRALLARILARDGHSTVTVSNAAEALERVAAVKPDVVLADVVMPGMDGIELCRALKADPAGRLTPVVLVTSLHGRDERITGIEAGADDFIVKPFDPEELLLRVQALGVRIRHLYLDREFASVAVLTFLNAQPFAAIVPVPVRGARLASLLRGRRSFTTS